MYFFSRRTWCCWCALLLLLGCTREHYRTHADRETYSILGEKTAYTPWMPPADYGIIPDPRSRFSNPGPIDDPLLPIPAPALYAYRLPDLPKRANRRSRDPAQMTAPDLRAPEPSAPETTVPEATDPGTTAPETPIHRLPPIAGRVPRHDVIRPVAFHGAEPLAPINAPSDAPSDANMATPMDAPMDVAPPSDSNVVDAEGELRLVAIPRSVWESLPRSCLMRMVEFQSVRDEYERTYRRGPSENLKDPSQRLSLEDIVELALINSRAYQTQKENLYRVALRLSLDRFDYDFKFARTGNRTEADYNHTRTGGITENALRVPTIVEADQVLATGGDLLARFANQVVLTFNGPDGFAADVGSDLLLDISQRVFQRDIVFENLTQSERDVVYAARDFARFRKELFRDLASDYYSLLRTYRGVEIATQDYFSNTRGFLQGEAEYRAGRLPRYQVDQFEQRSLDTRSSLITSCNSVATALDQLKLRIGLPTEMPLNLDLTELDELTLRDETRATAERVRRSRRNLVSERNQASTERMNLLLNAAISLTQTMLDLSEFRQRLGQAGLDDHRLQAVRAVLSTEEVRWRVGLNVEALQQERKSIPPSPLRIFQRASDLLESYLLLIRRQVDLLEILNANAKDVEELRIRLRELEQRFDVLRQDLETTVANRQLERIDELVTTAESLLSDVETLSHAVDARLEYRKLGPQQVLQVALERVDQLLVESERVITEDSGGLAPIEIDMDDAMLTALVQRFDLMNERGALADTWRRVKLAGDDLRSVLNLNASHLIHTRRGLNRVFDFTFDESDTRLALTLDTPLNRRAQRNAFRESLINYQVSLRNLIALEDDVKFSIRDHLRQLQVIREQYRIAVASAALANDRVQTTRLQLQFGIEGVRARDFLEAQQAYTRSVSEVATTHIAYIVRRIDLFLDMELLYVDQSGLWPDLYNENIQPQPNFDPPVPAHPYGELPHGVWYSHKVKRMLKVPPGHATIFSDQPNQPPGAGSGTLPLEELPPPGPNHSS